MKFGLVPVNVGVKSVDHIIGISQLAESVGMESVWTFEHVIVPEDYVSVGRDPKSIEISCMWNMQGGLDAIKAFQEAGASRTIVPIFALGKDPVEGLTKFADTIISKI